MVEKNIFLICLVVLTFCLLWYVTVYIVAKNNKTKEAERQRKEWNRELFELSEGLKEQMKGNIRALETYKIIEEMYSIQSFPQSNIAYQHQKLRLIAYNRKYNKKIISKKDKEKNENK